MVSILLSKRAFQNPTLLTGPRQYGGLSPCDPDLIVFINQYLVKGGDMEFKICQSSLLHCVIVSVLNLIRFRECVTS